MPLGKEPFEIPEHLAHVAPVVWGDAAIAYLADRYRAPPEFNFTIIQRKCSSAHSGKAWVGHGFLDNLYGIFELNHGARILTTITQWIWLVRLAWVSLTKWRQPVMPYPLAGHALFEDLL